MGKITFFTLFTILLLTVTQAQTGRALLSRYAAEYPRSYNNADFRINTARILTAGDGGIYTNGSREGTASSMPLPNFSDYAISRGNNNEGGSSTMVINDVNTMVVLSPKSIPNKSEVYISFLVAKTDKVFNDSKLRVWFTNKKAVDIRAVDYDKPFNSSGDWVDITNDIDLVNDIPNFSTVGKDGLEDYITVKCLPLL